MILCGGQEFRCFVRTIYRVTACSIWLGIRKMGSRVSAMMILGLIDQSIDEFILESFGVKKITSYS